MATIKTLSYIHPNLRIGKLCRFTLYTLLITLSFSCRRENDNPPTRTITFVATIDDAFTVEYGAPARTDDAPATITLAQANISDLYVFEGTTLLAHQTSADRDFGSPSVSLSYGQHSLTFVASPQSGQSFSAGVWSAPKANDCFGATVTLDISAPDTNEAIILRRCSYGLKWQSTDIVPASVRTLILNVSPMRESLTDGLHATAPYTRTYTYDVSAYAGRTISVTIYGLPEDYAVEESISTTITFQAADGTTLFTHTKSVPVTSNRRTVITGQLFNGSTSPSVRLTADWQPDHTESL